MTEYTPFYYQHSSGWNPPVVQEKTNNLKKMIVVVKTSTSAT